MAEEYGSPIIVDVMLTISDSKENKNGTNKRVISDEESKKRGALGSLKMQSLSSSAQRVLTAFNNEPFTQAANTIGEVTKYGGMIANLSNPTAVLTFATTLIAKMISIIVEREQKDAANKNAADTARISAGVYDITGKSTNTNWFSGRKEFR